LKVKANNIDEQLAAALSETARLRSENERLRKLLLLRAKQVGLIVEVRSLITRLQSEGGYYIDPGLIEKALLAAGE
jgi:Domain of unknown function (DUF3368)